MEGAPLDDVPYTDEEKAADEEARRAARRGEILSTEELLRQLNLILPPRS